MQRNPFPVYIAGKLMGWKWIDETGDESEKTYPTQMDALRDLLSYCDFLNNGPTLWQKITAWFRLWEPNS